MTETVPFPPGAVARWWQRHPRLVDLLVSVSWLLLCTPSLILTTRSPHFTMGVGAGIVVAVSTTAAAQFALRRSKPSLAFVFSLIAALPLIFTAPDVTLLAIAFGIYAIAVHHSVRRAQLAALVGGGVIALTGTVFIFWTPPLMLPAFGGTRSSDVISFVVAESLLVLVALLWGQNIGNRRRYIDGLIAHARHLERERDQQARLAALAERSRIARDIHDVVSHSLSVMVRLADGASAVYEHDPQRAKDAIAQVGTVGRSSLSEMRRVIGVLESAHSSSVPHSGTSIDDLPQLVGLFQGIDLPVHLTITGQARPPAGVQVAVFRVVQEALTNALRHANSPTEVNVLVEIGDGIGVIVTNDGATTSHATEENSGRGLVGMRERAALYGGSLSAGPDGAGNWIVSLSLPEER